MIILQKYIRSEKQYIQMTIFIKKWTKLSNIHKIIKIKEFVSKLLIDNNVDRDNLKNELVELVKSKKKLRKQIR